MNGGGKGARWKRMTNFSLGPTETDQEMKFKERRADTDMSQDRRTGQKKGLWAEEEEEDE